jgi:NAD(P)-dependent dehydrogenase (short-subunit alcohol dehydrogenase family)
MAMAAAGKPLVKRLLITGATGGMGRAASLLAADQGYDLLLADLSQPKLQQLAAECGRPERSATYAVLDVTQSASIAALVNTLEAGGGVDGIIHTVGLSPQMAEARKIIDVDLVGTVALLEQARPWLNSGGCAVCIASMSAYMVPANADIDGVLAEPLAGNFFDRVDALNASGHPLDNPGLAYAYAKRALKQYIAQRSYDWGREGKRFVSISPGLIDTDMGRLENAAMENFAAMRSLVALDRLGAPEDIAHTALFLLSEKAAYITGCDILVDGGFVAAMNRQHRPSN